MGMFYCDTCKTERKNSICQKCNKPTRKYWWTFGPDDNHPRSYRVYYNKDGSIARETGLTGGEE